MNTNTYLDILRSVALFRGIGEGELGSMLSCLGASVAEAGKDEYVLLAGDPVDRIGIVLCGGFHVVKEDSDGERTLIAALSPGDFFAEALCCAGVPESPVSVIATSVSEVMLLEYGRILRTCSNTCVFHMKLIENMLYVIANKNITLQNRMDVIGKKSLRTKILSFLESFGAEEGRAVTVPFNREELADFLCADRSALSHELSRMKGEGLIDYRKNRFTLLQKS